jgi:dipeptidyl aminopeptidase/acylaminoacyl peptidase
VPSDQDEEDGVMIRTAHDGHLRVALIAMAMLAATLVALVGAKPAEAKSACFPEGHDSIAFEHEGDIWVVSIMYLVNLTPNTAQSREVDPVVSPDGTYVAFASDQDGDFEIYTANVFTGEAEQVTKNRVVDRYPAWSPDGKWISYQSPHYSSPTLGHLLGEGGRHVKVAGMLAP